MRKLLSLVLALVLVAGQWAVQMHALSHAGHDLAVVLNGHHDNATRGKPGTPPLDHSRDRCVAFQAIDSAAAAPAAPVLALLPPCFTLASQHIEFLPAEPAHFSARAPPVFS